LGIPDAEETYPRMGTIVEPAGDSQHFAPLAKPDAEPTYPRKWTNVEPGGFSQHLHRWLRSPRRLFGIFKENVWEGFLKTLKFIAYWFRNGNIYRLCCLNGLPMVL
jgi:hypothetical protein